MLKGLSKEERDYLLGLYRDAYTVALGSQPDPLNPDLLPVLLSYASVLHEVGSDGSARKFLERLSSSLPPQPRWVGAMSDEESFSSPECGVGSPHRIGVTIYHDPAAFGPVRITGAGTTADSTLTTRVFTNVFAAALACDPEPTLITTVGWSLSLTPGTSALEDKAQDSVLTAALTPAGPAEPTADVPTMGMTAEEALSVIADSFERSQESTGLVRVMRWETQDAEYVEQRIRAALEEQGTGVHVLRSEPRHTEGSSVIHVMPLLRRDSTGTIVPVEIEIPYDSLGSQTVFNLLQRSRNAYMNQLIGAAQCRQAYARRAWSEQELMIKKWKAFSEECKAEICAKYPTVTITQAYDWDLGIDVPLPTPEFVPRRTYEEERRPDILESAKQHEERFAAIAKKLDTINRPGGRADILTFKLLIDSMIRRAVIAIPDDRFQEEYRRWLSVSSASIWAAITTWAKSNRIRPECLAADNICFNVHVENCRGRVLLRPMVLIDLHDFVVRIARAEGVMEVFPGGKTPSLADCFVPDQGSDLCKLSDLHGQFVQWMGRNCAVDKARQDGSKNLVSEIYGDGKIGTLIRLTHAKQSLFRGDVDHALQIIEEIRKFDVAAVYFWGAVAGQYKHLCDVPIPGLATQVEKRREQLLNISINVLIEYIKTKPFKAKSRKKTTPSIASETIASAAQAVKLTAPQAINYLGQLQACDPSFVAELAGDSPDIAALEQKSFGLSSKDQEKCSAAVSALSAMELLDFAEAVKDMAKALPYAGGRLSTDVKREIRELLKRRELLTVASLPSSVEFDELQNLL